jgi:hypothetical protein
MLSKKKKKKKKRRRRRRRRCPIASVTSSQLDIIQKGAGYNSERRTSKFSQL